VAVRHAKRGDLGVKSLADFVSEITAEVKERRL
jgi:threonyl-tRNA synthetase